MHVAREISARKKLGRRQKGKAVSHSRTLLLLAIVASSTLVGCITPRVNIDRLPDDRSLEVVLESNRTFTFPGCRIKFFVDIFNRTNARIDLGTLDVRINASPRDDSKKVALTKLWVFEWQKPVTIAPGKKITLPIRPKVSSFTSGQQHALGWQNSKVFASDFPIEQLQPGNYYLSAVVNDRFVSELMGLKVRPSPTARNLPVPGRPGNLRPAHASKND